VTKVVDFAVHRHQLLDWISAGSSTGLRCPSWRWFEGEGSRFCGKTKDAQLDDGDES
jgi:hypothetical protein